MSRTIEEVHALQHRDAGFIIFDAPGANLLTRAGFERISWILRDYRHKSSVKAIVFRGVDGKNFCGGTNLRWMQGLQNSPELGNETIDYFYRVGKEIIEYPKPTIAAIENGVCGGIGFEIATCCRHVVAAEKNTDTIKFAALANRFGFMLGLGVLWRLAHNIGIEHAARFLIKKEVTDLTDAYDLGIVDEVLPGKDFTEEVCGFARLAARGMPKKVYPCIIASLAHLSDREVKHLAFGCPAPAVKRTLKALELVLREKTFGKAMKLEKEIFKELFFSQNAKEGIDAFLNKREPKFSNIVV